MDRLNARLADLPPLGSGSHNTATDGACVMEAVAFIAGERWSDHPACACPVIATFLRTWNDALPDDERDALLRPLVPLIVGTRSTPAVEERRSLMAADWLIRVHTPAWLRLAGLTAQADKLAALPEITSMAQMSALRGPIEAVHREAYAAACAAAHAAVHAAEVAVYGAVRVATDGAAGYAARVAVRVAVRDAAAYAARDAAVYAAWASKAKLDPTRRELQQSALDLVRRMIAVTEAA